MLTSRSRCESVGVLRVQPGLEARENCEQTTTTKLLCVAGRNGFFLAAPAGFTAASNAGRCTEDLENTMTYVSVKGGWNEQAIH